MNELSNGTKIFLIVMCVLVMIWAYMQFQSKNECLLPGYSAECRR